MADLDSDGVYELLFTYNTQVVKYNICNIFTYKDGEVSAVAEAYYPEYYMLGKDGSIIKESKHSDKFEYYDYSDGELNLREVLIYDKEKNSMYPWTYNDEEVSAETGKSITLTECLRVKEKYEYMNLKWINFKDVTDIVWDGVTYETKEYDDIENLTFDDIENKAFGLYGSYNGENHNVSLIIGEDGTFRAHYYKYGDDVTGVGHYYQKTSSFLYPNGTVRECYFTGKFTSLTKTGPYEYRMECEFIEPEGTVGEEKIVDGTRYITVEPYGFEDGCEFCLILPGKEVELFPEEYRGTVQNEFGSTSVNYLLYSCNETKMYGLGMESDWTDLKNLEPSKETPSGSNIADMTLMGEAEAESKQKRFTDKDDLTFADLSEKFCMYQMTGNGYGPVIRIAEDGTFTGEHKLSVYNEAEDTDCQGAVEKCTFHGKFTDLTKVGPYEYHMQCEYIEIEGTIGEEKLELVEYDAIYGDGTDDENTEYILKTITTDCAYGFINSGTFIVYLPGFRKLDLPESYLKWNLEWPYEDEICEEYILYSTGDDLGFVSNAD